MDMAAKLLELGLTKFLPFPAWPPTLAVDELAAKVQRLKRSGQKAPFVFAELRRHAQLGCWRCGHMGQLSRALSRFLPPTFSEHSAGVAPENSEAAAKPKACCACGGLLWAVQDVVGCHRRAAWNSPNGSLHSTPTRSAQQPSGS